MIRSFPELKSNCRSIADCVSFSVFTLIQQEELMGWHLSGVTRTRICVIGVNFSEFLIKEKKIEFELARNSSYQSLS